MSELVAIKTSEFVSELAVAKSYLESEGIPCVIKNEQTAMLMPFFLNSSGAQLQVLDENAERARELLIEGGFINKDD